MNIEEVHMVISQLENEFDSHDFIRKYVCDYPHSYGELLCKHNNVNTAHGEIANFLSYKADELHITQLPEKAVSTDIFGNETSNAKWRKLTK